MRASRRESLQDTGACRKRDGPSDGHSMITGSQGIGASCQRVFSFACDSQDDLALLAALGDAGEGGERVLELED